MQAPLFSYQSPVFAWGHVLPKSPPPPRRWFPTPCPEQVPHRLMGLRALCPAHPQSHPIHFLPLGSLFSTWAVTAPPWTYISFLTHHKSLFSPCITSSASLQPTPLPPPLPRVSSQRTVWIIISLPCSTTLYGSPLPPEINTSFLTMVLNLPVVDVCCFGFPSFLFSSLDNFPLGFLGGRGRSHTSPPLSPCGLGAAFSLTSRRGLCDPGWACATFP